MNKGKDNNYLIEAFEACDKLGNLPEDRSVNRIRRRLMREIGEAFRKMNEHDREIFKYVVKDNASINRELIEILSVIDKNTGSNEKGVVSVNGKADEMGSDDYCDLVDEWWKLRNSENYDLDEGTRKKIEEMVENSGRRIYKEHSENEKDNTTRIEFTIGGYKYEVLQIDGKVHSKYKVKNRLRNGPFKIPQIDSVGMRGSLFDWEDKELKEYVLDKYNDDRFELIDEKKLKFYLMDIGYEADLKGDQNIGALFSRLTGLDGIFPCAYPVPNGVSGSKTKREFFISPQGYGFAWGAQGNVGMFLIKRTKIEQSEEVESIDNGSAEKAYENSLERLRISFPDIPEDLTGKEILIEDPSNDVECIIIRDNAMEYTLKNGVTFAIYCEKGNWECEKRGYMTHKIDPNDFYEEICNVANEPDRYKIKIIGNNFSDNREKQIKTFEKAYENSLERLRISFPDIPEDLTGKQISIKNSTNDVEHILIRDNNVMLYYTNSEILATISLNGNWIGYGVNKYNTGGSYEINPNFFCEGIYKVADHPEKYIIEISRS